MERIDNADQLFDELIAIADNSENDQLLQPDGSTRNNPAAVARDKLRIKTRIWMLSRLRPGRYGNRTQITLDTPAVAATTDAARAQAILTLLGTAGPDALPVLLGLDEYADTARGEASLIGKHFEPEKS